MAGTDVAEGNTDSATDGQGNAAVKAQVTEYCVLEGIDLEYRIRCYGEVRAGAATAEMVHPEYQRLSADEVVAVEETLTPLYPTTEGVHQLKMRDLARQAVQRLIDYPHSLLECLPDAIRAQYRLMPLADAVRTLHQPAADVSLDALQHGQHPAQRRLAFEELLAHYLSLRSLRALADTEQVFIPMKF